MRTILVVDKPDRWPLQIPGLEVVAAERYLSDPAYSGLRGVVVFNLCRSYAYQRTGYYVSLLAEARGHRPQPNVLTLQDLKHRGVTRIASDEIYDLVQRLFRRLKSDTFVLSIYFGRSIAQAHLPLARALYEQFPAPLLRARFARDADGDWELRHIAPIAGEDIPPNHRDFVVDTAARYFTGRRGGRRRRRAMRFHLAILTEPTEVDPPSDEGALVRFERAARNLQIGTDRITREDTSRLPEFDGLFIRTTTQVNHYTYRFAQRARAEGLVVIDDPLSIIRCTNKVYLKELLERQGIVQPRSMLLHRDNADHDVSPLGFPCVLKEPDGSFSRGVKKVKDEAEAKETLERLFQSSAIVLAQEYLPTEYDWRIGVIDGKALYACRYHMAPGHWQIVQRDGKRPDRYGRVDTMAVEDAPRSVIRLALKAAKAIGDGLYGVDIKQAGRRLFVIEVNDNPTLQSGVEDRVLKGDLYTRILEVFLNRMAMKRAGTESPA